MPTPAWACHTAWACHALPATLLAVAVLYLSVAAALASAQSAPATQPASKPANLVRNGDFEQLDDAGRLPAGWTTEHPGNVRVVDSGDEFGRVVEMTGGKKLMATYGVDLTGEKIPIKPNTRYRCTGYTRSEGPNLKVFVRGYATVARRVKGELKTFDDQVYTMRKDIDAPAEWERFNLDFEIIPAAVFSDHKHEIKYVRIKLWAYWPAGTCFYDDIRFEEVGPVPASRIRRPDAVTHTGVEPRLGERGAEHGGAEAFDEEQTWLDAANAFRAEEYARALPLAERLVAHAPHKGAYRILLARTLEKLKRWPEADRAAAWLLAKEGDKPAQTQPTREIEPWQRDWALVVRAQACWHAGRPNQARQYLKEVIRKDASPHARQAAERLLRQMESDG